MTYARTSIQDFSTANLVYANAEVTFYTVNNGQKTNTKATLYSNISGDGKLKNPQTLDNNGKFTQPVYIENPVIMTVKGLGNTPDHDTGIVYTPVILSGTGTPEGTVTASVGALFTREDGGAGTTLYIKESGSGNTGWRAV